MKHSLLTASSPHLYLDRITAYYERALDLLPEENDSISYSLAIAYAELGDERKAEEAWGCMKDSPVEFNKRWVHAELMHQLRLYDRAVPEIEEYVLREAVDLSTHLDRLRDVLTLNGDEELSRIADEKAVRFRELFELWEGFDKMSDVSKSEAASDQHAMLENLAGFILTDPRDKKVSACPLFANVNLGGEEKTEKSGADYMADILSALGDKTT